jgi:hypothetical protein
MIFVIAIIIQSVIIHFYKLKIIMCAESVILFQYEIVQTCKLFYLILTQITLPDFSFQT